MRTLALIYRSFGAPCDCLRLEDAPLAPRAPEMLRVAMLYAPMNPSDLIPITGAYGHRITIPAVAGYEGVGQVVSAPPSHRHWIGRRVLPLRGAGTWQQIVDCDPARAIPVPDGITDDRAARAYINPLAAASMLSRWPVTGKHVLLSGAGSHCANLLGAWAQDQGAARVTGLYRSESRRDTLQSLGIAPVPIADRSEIVRCARDADLVFDSLGGAPASLILDTLQAGQVFIGYGLLTGQPIAPSRTPQAAYERFHLRDTLATMRDQDWQSAFEALWKTIMTAPFPAVTVFPLRAWRDAIAQTDHPGAPKPLLDLRA